MKETISSPALSVIWLCALLLYFYSFSSQFASSLCCLTSFCDVRQSHLSNRLSDWLIRNLYISLPWLHRQSHIIPVKVVSSVKHLLNLLSMKWWQLTEKKQRNAVEVKSSSLEAHVCSSVQTTTDSRRPNRASNMDHAFSCEDLSDWNI